MISFSSFMNLPGKKLSGFRLDDGVYLKCAAVNEGNTCLNVRFTPGNILYSANSLSESKRRYDEYEYISEAEIKTYPTDKFLRVFMKTLADICGFKTVTAGMTLTDEYLSFENGRIFIDDSFDVNRMPDIDCFIQAKYDYVEKDIAGKIVYRLFMDGRYDVDQTRNTLKRGLSELIKAGDICGYNYIIHQLYDYLNDQFVPEFVFESKFQTADIKISDKLYHIAPLSLKDRILRFGISPKSKSSAGSHAMCHPDRVYMFNLYDENMFKSFCRRARKQSCGYSRDLQMKYFKYEYAIFEIDKTAISNLLLFRDNNFESVDPSKPTAVYSYTNIPPAAIKFVGEFDLKNK